MAQQVKDPALARGGPGSERRARFEPRRGNYRVWWGGRKKKKKKKKRKEIRGGDES